MDKKSRYELNLPLFLLEDFNNITKFSFIFSSYFILVNLSVHNMLISRSEILVKQSNKCSQSQFIL